MENQLILDTSLAQTLVLWKGRLLGVKAALAQIGQRFGQLNLAADCKASYVNQDEYQATEDVTAR